MLRPGGHWFRTNRNGLPSADSVRIVGRAASISATLGRAGTRQRSAACIAAVVAGASTPGVSMVTRSKPLRARALNPAVSRLGYLGAFSLTPLEPLASGRLRVEVDDVNLQAALLCGDSQGHGEAALARAALLCRKCENLHRESLLSVRVAANS